MPRPRKEAVPRPNIKYRFRFEYNRAYELIYMGELENGRLLFWNYTTKSYTSLTKEKFSYACAKQLEKKIYIVQEDSELKKKKEIAVALAEEERKRREAEEQTRKDIKAAISDLLGQSDMTAELIKLATKKSNKEIAQNLTDWINGKKVSPLNILRDYYTAIKVAGYQKTSLL